MKLKIGLLAVVLILSLQKAQSQLPYQQVLAKYKDFLIAQDTTSTDSIKLWVNTLQEDGTWKAVDYKDKNSSSWKTTEHLDRIVKISIAYHKKGNAFYLQKSVLDVILKSSKHWLNYNYKNSNWWYNDIGVPQFWRDILTLNMDLFKETERNKALKVLGQYNIRANFTGANLTWSADLALHYGLLTQNDSLINKGSNLLANEIKISNGEGIRQDFSYHQHGAGLQTHHYGASFLKENIRLAYELQNSPWAFPSPKIDILKNFLVNGWQWMGRGIYISPATVDRAISRKRVLKQDISKLLPYLIKLYPAGKADGLEQMLKSQANGLPAQTGFRYFPFSDFGAYQHNNFSFFLKTISTRTEITEQLNGENQKGTFLNLGNTYFIKNGKEYTDLMPLWDWNKLPGTTNFRGAKTINRSNFVGGLAAGSSGLTVMDFETVGEKSKLAGNKFWAVHKGRVFCLIANLSLIGSPDSVFTTIDQNRLQDIVYVNSEKNLLKTNLKNAHDVKWISHHGFTYVPLTAGNSVDLNINPIDGSWSSISRSGSPNIASEKVFKLVLNHQNNSSSAYMVDGITPINQIQSLINRPDWKIISNTKSCQAITFNDGVSMLSFHQKHQLKYGKNTINVSDACLLIIDQNSIAAIDPLKKGGNLEIILNGKRIKLNLPADGTAVNYKL